MRFNKISSDTSKSYKTKYSCLCPEISKKLDDFYLMRTLTNFLYGFPMFMWLGIGAFILTETGIIVWLSYTLLSPKTVTQVYYSKCSANTDCNTALGLICATQDQLCNCPLYYMKGRCDCTSGNYWNGKKCTRILQNNQTGCTSHHNCDQSKELKCLNNICKCAPPKQWNSSLNACDFVFERCAYENVGVEWMVTAVKSARQDYFVDMCTEICYKTRYTYALIGVLSSSNYCMCANSYTSLMNWGCNTYCLGLNGLYYPCGMLNLDTKYRAYYKLVY